MALTLTEVVGAEGGWSARERFRYVVTARLQADKGDPKYGPLAALQATGLAYDATYRYPLTGTPTETDASCFLQSIDVTQEEDGNQYKATIVFAPYDVQQDKGPTDENGKPDPFAARPSVNVQSETEEIAAMYSRNGNSVQNTAGDPLPGLTLPVNLSTFSIKRTERHFPRTLIDAMPNRLNDDEWLGFPAESVLCRKITANDVYNHDIRSVVWECTYEFAYKSSVTFDDGGDEYEIIPGHAAIVLNAGLRYKDPTTQKRKQIIVDNAPVSEPVPLKEDGTVADPDDEPHYLAFDIYPLADFSVFGFPPDTFSAGTPL
jgi:hypothetical protein